MSHGYAIDLGVDWVKAGEVETGTFEGHRRATVGGQWNLEAPREGVNLDTAPENINTIIVTDTTLATPAIVYAGQIVSVGSVAAGLLARYSEQGVTYSWRGVDLLGLLNTRLCDPNVGSPQQDPPLPGTYGVTTGPASNVATGIMRANLAPGFAEPNRAWPGVVVNFTSTGPTRTWRVRWEKLGTIVAQLCDVGDFIVAADMPTPGSIVYDLRPGVDRTASVLIDVTTLATAVSFMQTVPSGTRVIAGGSGELAARVMGAYELTGNVTGSDRIEVFYDVNNLDLAASVQSAAEGEHARRVGELSVSFEPGDIGYRYHDQWREGDAVTFQLPDSEVEARIDGASFRITPDEAFITPIVGRVAVGTNTQIIEGLTALGVEQGRHVA